MALLEYAQILGVVRERFIVIPDLRKGSSAENIPPADFFMSGLAVFILKFPSLLQFDKKRNTPRLKENLSNLFKITGKIPCDTHLRNFLDMYDPLTYVRPALIDGVVFAEKKGLLDQFSFMDDYYLCPIDGTGEFSSSKVHCEQCCTRTSRNGEISYYHQMLGAVLAHPERKTVLPLSAEPITKQDGQTKNDCEINSSKRLLPQIKNDFPELNLILVLDALFGNAPHIRLIESLEYKYIITAKRIINIFLTR